MTTLVTGATGLVGRSVVRHLLDAGESVRALTRRPETAALPPGVDVVAGDLTEPDSLSSALVDVDRLFLIAVPETAWDVVNRAVAAGVRRVVDLSSGAVTYGMDTQFHLPVEQAVEGSRLEWAHVRPGEFANNKAILWGASIRAERAVYFPAPDRVQVCPVHEADIADVAGTLLLEDSHIGAAYTFTGPGLITVREQVAAIAAALEEKVRFEEVTREEAVRLLRERDPGAAATAEVVLGLKVLYARPPGQDDGAAAPPATPTPTPEAVLEVTGKPARTFGQ